MNLLDNGGFIGTTLDFGATDFYEIPLADPNWVYLGNAFQDNINLASFTLTLSSGPSNGDSLVIAVAAEHSSGGGELQSASFEQGVGQSLTVLEATGLNLLNGVSALAYVRNISNGTSTQNREIRLNFPGGSIVRAHIWGWKTDVNNIIVLDSANSSATSGTSSSITLDTTSGYLIAAYATGTDVTHVWSGVNNTNSDDVSTLGEYSSAYEASASSATHTVSVTHASSTQSIGLSGAVFGRGTSYKEPDVTPTGTYSSGTVTDDNYGSFDAVFAADLTFPTTPTDGLIWETGATGGGAWVGIRDSGATLRCRGGDGSTAKTVSDADTAVVDITDFPKDGEVHELMWDFEISTGTARVFIDGILKGQSSATDGSFISNIFAGGAQGTYLTTASGVATGESLTACNFTDNGNGLRAYDNNLAQIITGTPGNKKNSGIWGLPAVLDSFTDSEAGGALYAFASNNFTPAGATGFSGPSLSQCQTEYSTQAFLSGYFTVSGSGLQEWTVPETATYSFTVRGASGGDGHLAGSSNNRGGYGAIITGDVTLTQGDVLHIMVGQMGIDGTGSSCAGSGGGGGGGTFVYNNTTSTLLFAAGGGGGGATSGGPNTQDASLTNDGKDSAGDAGAVSGGTGGSGGAAGTGCVTGSAGGAGYTGNGSAAGSAPGGSSFTNGGLGGNSINRDGGFGGGGSTDTYCGGGGGGYSGGAGGGLPSCACTNLYAGGGGGTYYDASVSNPSVSLHNNSAHGLCGVSKN